MSVCECCRFVWVQLLPPVGWLERHPESEDDGSVGWVCDVVYEWDPRDIDGSVCVTKALIGGVDVLSNIGEGELVALNHRAADWAMEDMQ
jgi:hypothetical protein